MKIISTNFDNVYLLEEDIYHDDRGFFMETWNEMSYTSKGLINNLPCNVKSKDDGTMSNTYFVQDNMSQSKQGVFRGLHYQTGSHGQSKLVRVLRGAVVDFIVDLREKSDTYGKFDYFLLNEWNKKSLFIPPYFAHGFLSLEDDTIFTYKCGNYYDKASEGSVNYSDPIIRHVKDKDTTIVDIISNYIPYINEDSLNISYKDRHAPKFLKRKY